MRRGVTEKRGKGWKLKHWRSPSSLTQMSFRKRNYIRGRFQSMCHGAAVNQPHTCKHSQACVRNMEMHQTRTNTMQYKWKFLSMSCSKRLIAFKLRSTWWLTRLWTASHVFVNKYDFTETWSRMKIILALAGAHTQTRHITHTYTHITTIILLFSPSTPCFN